MAALMSHQEWMKLTYGGVTSVRSGKLKAVDTALANYHQSPGLARMELVHKALTAWMGEKGSDWKSSVRNGKNAVDTLHKQLLGTVAPGADAASLKALQDGAKADIDRIFGGTQITWKNAFRVKLNSDEVAPDPSLLRQMGQQYKASASTNKWGLAGNTAGAAMASSSLNTMAKGGGSGVISGLMSKLVAEVVPSGAQTEVLKAVQLLVPSFQVQFAAVVVPLAGILVAAGTTLWNTGNAVHKQYGVVQTRMHRDRSLAGVEAAAAINALIRILERERNADIFAASVSVTELGGKIAGLAIDGGTASNTAIGLAANIAKLLNIVRIVYRDVSEKNAANKLIQWGGGGIAIDVVQTCPLLGCYLVCCLPSSTLMAMITQRFGQTGWMDVAERTAAHHIAPLREKAREVIKGHRFEIIQLERFPGMLVENEAEKARMLQNVGRSGMQGGGAGAFPDRIRA
jgi:hypothetical protein